MLLKIVPKFLSSLLVLALALPGIAVSGGNFTQSDWREAVIDTNADCDAVDGVWAGGQCTPQAPASQSGWRAFQSVSSPLVVINSGQDIQAAKTLSQLVLTENADFPLPANPPITHTLEADFNTASSITDAVVAGGKIELGFVAGGGWTAMNQWTFDPNDSGSELMPALGDMDGDGDLDMMIGSVNDSRADYYENLGDGLGWSSIRSYGNRKYGGGGEVRPSLRDVDFDGDLDLVASNDSNDELRVYRNLDMENDGFLNGVVWEGGDTGADYGAWYYDYVVPAYGDYHFNTRAVLGDLDNDGDQDVIECDDNADNCEVIRNYDLEDDDVLDGPRWAVDSNFFDITSLTFNASFSEATKSPGVGDVDGDGDLDLFLGHKYGHLKLYRNQWVDNGSDSFVATGLEDWALPDLSTSNSAYATPELADLNGDGYADLVVGVREDSSGVHKIFTYLNGGYGTFGSVVSAVINPGVHAGFTTVDFSVNEPTLDTSVTLYVRFGNNRTDTSDSSWTAWSEVVNSGDTVTPTPYKRYAQYKVELSSNDSAVTPSFEEITFHFDGHIAMNNVDIKNNGIQLGVISGEPQWSVEPNWTLDVSAIVAADPGDYIYPRAGDIDGDGDIDFMIGDGDGINDIVHGFEFDNGVWTENQSWNLSTSFVVNHNEPRPYLVDQDLDGDLDLLIFKEASGQNSTTLIYENIGSGTDNPQTPDVDESKIYAPVWDLVWNSGPLSAYVWDGGYLDMDGDGDMDSLGRRGSGLSATQNLDVENDGLLDGVYTTTTRLQWNVIDSGIAEFPYLRHFTGGDLNGDGNAELIVGALDGGSYVYENLGGAANPVWQVKPEWNPPSLDPFEFTDVAKPNLADVDGDGDLDLLVFDENRMLHGYRNTPVYTYHSSGAYTSNVFNINDGAHAGLKTLDFTTTVGGAGVVTVDVRAGDSEDLNDGSWSGWTTINNPGSEGNIASLGSAGYMQYRVTLQSLGSANSIARLDDITIAYDKYVDGELISSPYDSQDALNRLHEIFWSQTEAAGTNVQVQVRTAPALAGTWASWAGPDGSSSTYWDSENTSTGGCAEASGVVTCNIIPALFSDGSNDRWMQYKLIAKTTAGGTATPSIAAAGLGYRSNTPGITVTPVSGLVTSEDLTSATFSVTLDTMPSDTVTLPISIASLEANINTTLLTFTTGDWDQPHVVTVTGQDDFVVDGDVSYVVQTGVAAGAAEYIGVEADDVSLINLDNEAGVRIVSLLPYELITSESAGAKHTASFQVSLTKAPINTSTVMIYFNGVNAAEGQLSQSFVSFDDSNWNQPIEIILTGVDDDVKDNNAGYVIDIPVITGSGDASYDGYDPQNIAVTNIDDDSSGIIVTYSDSRMDTTEAGGLDSFTISLRSKPTNNVTIHVSSDNFFEATPLSFSLLFTPTDWNEVRTVYVQGMEDYELDGDQDFNITFPSVTSDDLDYNNYVIDPIPGLNLDDEEAASITVSPVTYLGQYESQSYRLITDADGGEAVFSVVLDQAPGSLVQIPVDSNNIDEGTVSTNQLAFDNDNWSIPQYVVVTGNDNTPSEEITNYNIVLGAAVSAGIYSDLDADDVLVKNLPGKPGLLITPSDDDAPFYLQNAVPLVLNVSLTAPPAPFDDDIVIAIGEGDGLNTSVNQLVFTTTDWSDPKQITVTNKSYNYGRHYITFSAREGAYSNFRERYYVTTVQTNSNPANVYDVAFTSYGVETSESGGTAKLGVVLSNAYGSADVQINISGVDPTEGTLDKTTLTFQQATATVPQYITITGLDDNDVDGTVMYDMTATISGNQKFLDDPVRTIRVSNIDDEAGVNVDAINMVTSEMGYAQTVGFTLNQRPAHVVTFSLSTDDTSEGIISPRKMTFSPENWNSPQYAILAGVNDAESDGPMPYNYEASNFISLDSAFNNIGTFSFPAINNDVSVYTAMVLDGDGTVEVGEDGSGGNVIIKFSSPIDKEIIIPLIVETNAGQVIVPSSIVIPPTTYSGQLARIKVLAVDDDAIDGSVISRLSFGNFVSDDPNWSGYSLSPIDLLTVDNEVEFRPVFDNGGLLSNSLPEFGRLGRVALGDFNGDGHKDLVGAGGSEFPTIYYGDSSNDFNASTHIVELDFLRSQYLDIWENGEAQLITGNFNGDEYDDLLAVSSEQGGSADGHAIVFWGGPGDLGASYWIVSGSTTNDEIDNAAVGRFNNDNYDDIVLLLGGSSYGQLAVFYGQADGLPAATSPLDTTDIIAGTSDAPLKGHILAGDLDDNGYDDILAGSVLGNPVDAKVYFNSNGTGMTSTPPSLGIEIPHTQTYDIELGDINNDGDLDVLVSGITASTSSGVYGFHGPFAAGAGESTPDWQIEKNGSGLGSQIALLDANGDGFNDLLVGLGETIYLYPGTGNIADMDTAAGGSFSDGIADAGFGYLIERLGPLDGDGYDYFVVTAPEHQKGLEEYRQRGVMYVTRLRPPTVPAIMTTPSAGLITTEWDSGSSSASFNVSLQKPPTADVELHFSSNSEGSVSPTTVTFTPQNWRNALVTVTGEDDVIVDGPVTYDIEITTVTSALEYQDVTGVVSVTNLDDDSHGVTVTPTSGAETTESGGRADISFVLTSPPQQPVDILFSSDKPAEGLPVGSKLTFTSANWDVPQFMSVQGQDDAWQDGDKPYTIITSIFTSDANYSVVEVEDVSLTNLDNDSVPGVSIVATKSKITEGGNAAKLVVTRTGDTSMPLNVFYRLGGTADNGDDYNTLDGVVTISSGSASTSVSVSAVADLSLDQDEVIEVSLIENTFYDVTAPSQVSLLIVDVSESGLPSVDFFPDQIGLEGKIASVKVVLSSNAPAYPLRIPFTVGGSATQGTDHIAYNGEIVIDAGRVGEYQLGMIDDGIPDAGETVIFTLSSVPLSEVPPYSPAAILGGKRTHTVTIVEGDNIAPDVELVPTQYELITRIMVIGRTSTITANVTDENVTDLHTYDWSETHADILAVEIDNGRDREFVFDSTSLAAGFYKVILTVTDNGLSAQPTRSEMLLELVASEPVLGFDDSDGDGVVDFSESFDDSDNDGVPDYLDSSTVLGNELQVLSGVESYMMKTEVGLTLSLGDVAFAAGADGALTSTDDISLYGDDGGVPTEPAQDSVAGTGHYYDFVVSDLPSVGQSVGIVIPLLQPLPFNAQYRKYDPDNGWRDFVVDEKNAIYSAVGSPGLCPSPGDPVYLEGLYSGDNCIMLKIEDGGPNDTDGALNRVVRDPSHVVQITDEVVAPPSGQVGGVGGAGDGDGDGADADAGAGAGADAGGGGILHAVWLVLLWIYVIAGERRIAVASRANLFKLCRVMRI